MIKEDRGRVNEVAIGRKGQEGEEKEMLYQSLGDLVEEEKLGQYIKNSLE